MEALHVKASTPVGVHSLVVDVEEGDHSLGIGWEVRGAGWQGREGGERIFFSINDQCRSKFVSN